MKKHLTGRAAPYGRGKAKPSPSATSILDVNEAFPYAHLTDLKIIKLYEDCGFSSGSSDEIKTQVISKFVCF